MKVAQILLFPFAILYGLAMRLRNFFYDKGFFASTSFNIPIISVGNLSVGGTGKSPHIEYLIDLLANENTIATLSRGYGRKTKGFILVGENNSAQDVGDEPLQFKKKFRNIMVAVDGNRVRGIEKIISKEKNIDVILLDDAFQHRSVKPGLSILLTDYNQPFYNDFVLPSGTLREPKAEMKRADIIIVTKTPDKFLDSKKENIIRNIHPLSHQQIYFSKIIYSDFVPITKKAMTSGQMIKEFFFDARYSIVLFTGIATTTSLVNYLSAKNKELIHVDFPDHHDFTKTDFEKVVNKYNILKNDHKIILTTEKDAVRLAKSEIKNLLDEYPVYYIPITIQIDDTEKFNKQIIDYVKKNKRSS